MTNISLTEEQVKLVVNEYLDKITQPEMIDLLIRITQYRRDELDHIELVKQYMKIVVKYCSLHKDFFRR